jgi:ABC-2 type transport system ATP-binding protein
MNIKLDRLSKNYGKKNVLSDLSLEIKSGSICGLLGGNGAGKTTTLQIILGFLRPDQGSVFFDDQLIQPHAASHLSQIAYIPENVMLYPELSGLENLSYFSSLTGIISSQDTLLESLCKLGLSQEQALLPTSQYSKGMRQRVAIAIALQKKAKLFLMDEPTSGLDPLASVQLSNIMKNLSSTGITILLTTHDLWHLSLNCDHVAILHKGNISRNLTDAKDLSPAQLVLHYQQIQAL